MSYGRPTGECLGVMGGPQNILELSSREFHGTTVGWVTLRNGMDFSAAAHAVGFQQGASLASLNKDGPSPKDGARAFCGISNES